MSIDNNQYLSPPFFSNFRTFVKNELDARALDRNRLQVPFIKMIPGFNFGGNKKKYILKGLSVPAGTSAVEYNFNQLYSPDRNFRPLAGITGANIEYKNVTGATRRADISWVCFTLEQLELLSPYFMHPGMTCLIEWGWNTSAAINKIIDDTDKYDDYKLHTYYAKTQEKAKLSNGNYDALLGIIINYEYKLSSNGVFECKTTVCGIGDLMDGLSIINQFQLDPNESNNVQTESKVTEPASPPITLRSAFERKIVDDQIAECVKSGKVPTLYATNVLTGEKSKEPETEHPIIWIDDKSIEEETKLRNKSDESFVWNYCYSPVYITWGYFEDYILNQYVAITDGNNIPLFKFNSSSSKTQMSKWLRTTDLSTCIFPMSDVEKVSLDGYVPLKILLKKITPMDMKDESTGKSYGYVRNILVNFELIKESVLNSKTLLDCIGAILSKINDASQNYFDLKLQILSEMDVDKPCSYSTYAVVDMGYMGVNIKDEENEKSIYTFRTKSFYTPNIKKDQTLVTSVIKNVSFNSKLSSEAALNVFFSAHSNQRVSIGNQSLYNLYGLFRASPNEQKNSKDDFANSPLKTISSIPSDVNSPANSDSASKNAEKMIETYGDLANFALAYLVYLPIASIGYSPTNDTLHYNNKKLVASEIYSGIELMKSMMLTSKSRNKNEIPTSQEPMVPVELNLELNGISGIRTGDIFTLDYIPNIYKVHGVFQIKKISQEISREHWTTKIIAGFRIQLNADTTTYTNSQQAVPNTNLKPTNSPKPINKPSAKQKYFVGERDGYRYKYEVTGVKDSYMVLGNKAFKDREDALSLLKSNDKVLYTIGFETTKNNLKPSPGIIEYIKSIETLHGKKTTSTGVVSTPKLVEKNSTIYTIGWGHYMNNPYNNSKPIQEGDVWTLDQSNIVFNSDIEAFIRGLHTGLLVHCKGCEINQTQFDALLSYAYNKGLATLVKYSIYDAINSKNPAILAKAIRGGPVIDKRGTFYSGLAKRRLEESLMVNEFEIHPA